MHVNPEFTESRLGPEKTITRTRVYQGPLVFCIADCIFHRLACDDNWPSRYAPDKGFAARESILGVGQTHAAQVQ